MAQLDPAPLSGPVPPSRDHDAAAEAGACVPVARAAAEGWRFAMSRGFGHARGRTLVPISATELLNVAQDIPLLFRRTDLAWQVVGVLAPAALKRPVIDGRGSWRGEYAPVLLRLYPFVTDGPRGSLAVDRRGLRKGPGEGHPLADAAGRPTDRLKQVMATADAARDGIRRLGERVAALDAAGLVAPAPMLLRFERPCATVAPLFTVDGHRLAGLSRATLAALVDGAPSALDLAVAAMFSARRFAASVVVETRAGMDDEIASRIDAGLRASPSPPAAQVAPDPLPSIGYTVDASVNLDFSNLPF